MFRLNITTFLSSLLILMFVFTSGCANYGTPVSQDPVMDMDDGETSFNVIPDKSIIYIYRIGTNSDEEMPVNLDGKLVGMTRSKTYFMLTVEPGEHEIFSEEGNFSSLTINTQAGKNYFILQEVVKTVTSTGATLQQVSELEGRSGVRESQLIS